MSVVGRRIPCTIGTHTRRSVSLRRDGKKLRGADIDVDIDHRVEKLRPFWTILPVGLNRYDQMSAGTWDRELVDWFVCALRCNGSDEERELLRRARHLLVSAPAKVRELLDSDVEAQVFEKLLDVGAHESAARRLIAIDDCGYLLSRSPKGRFMCTVHAASQVPETSFETRCESLAFTGAILRGVYEIVGARSTGVPALRLVEK